jgi:hypothetical protein
VGPILLWHAVIADIWNAYEFQAKYFLGWAPWLLMVAGLGFFVPVLLSAGADPEGRFYPRARNAYMGWGTSLYLLGFLLATQVARLHDGALSGF